jgi:hypothetical protein
VPSSAKPLDLGPHISTPGIKLMGVLVFVGYCCCLARHESNDSISTAGFQMGACRFLLPNTHALFCEALYKFSFGGGGGGWAR